MQQTSSSPGDGTSWLEHIAIRLRRRWAALRKTAYYSDPRKYWEERHVRSGTCLVGVGCAGLDENRNERDYEAKWMELERLLREAPLPREARVLDAGCGIGIFSNRIRRSGFCVEAVDFSAEAVALAEAQWGTEISWHISPLDDFRPSTSYHAVVCIDVLFHVVDDQQWERSVVNLASLVKSGGLLIVQEELVGHTIPMPANGRAHVRRRSLRDYRRLLDSWGDMSVHRRYQLPEQGTTKDLLVFERASS